MNKYFSGFIGWTIRLLPLFINIILVVVLLGVVFPDGYKGLEHGVDKGVVVSCGSSDWGDFEGDYPTIWVKTENGHFSYFFKYAPEISNTLNIGSFYSFEYGYEYMPSGVSAGDGWYVKSLSRIRDSDGDIVWGDWWFW